MPVAVPLVALSEGGLRLVPERGEEPGGLSFWHTDEGVFCDGKPLISAHDITFSDPGKVALPTSSVTYFDTIFVTPLE